MNEMPALPLGTRRDEDVALDLMKFIAMTTNYGKATTVTPGFQGGGAKAVTDDQAQQLLGLYTKCLETVKGKK
ncbi:MAG TPA: hypothetical protein VG897_01235 [Terriglobales bacterium]|nr:hypothetical protein [Terriglobales bacterium]